MVPSNWVMRLRGREIARLRQYDTDQKPYDYHFERLDGFEEVEPLFADELRLLVDDDLTNEWLAAWGEDLSQRRSYCGDL